MHEHPLTFQAVKQALTVFPSYLEDEGTRRAYGNALQRFVIWWDQDAHQPFLPQLLRRYRDYLVLSTLRPMAPLRAQSVNLSLSALRTFCRWLVLKGALVTNPMIDLTNLPISNKPVRGRLTERELASLLKTFDRQSEDVFERELACRNYSVVFLSVSLGLRFSDLISLRRRDLLITDGVWSLAVPNSQSFVLDEADRACLEEYILAHDRWHHFDSHSDSRMCELEHPLFAQGRKGHRTARAMADTSRTPRQCQPVKVASMQSVVRHHFMEAALVPPAEERRKYGRLCPDALHRSVSPVKYRAEHFIPDFTKPVSYKRGVHCEAKGDSTENSI